MGIIGRKREKKNSDMFSDSGFNGGAQ